MTLTLPMNRRGLACPRHAIACAVIAWCALAQAEDGGPTFRFSGFGTVGAVHSSEKNADFTSGSELPNGAGHTRRWDTNQDSQLGAQVDVRFGDRFSASAQAITRYRDDGTYTPEVMMAFGRWQALPEVAFRLGRLPIPVFLISDYRNVRYSQATLRPPVDVYRSFPMYHYDGGDATWTTTVGATALSANVYAGRMKIGLPDQGSLESPRAGGARLTANWGDWTAYGSVMRGYGSSVSTATVEAAFAAVRNGMGGLAPAPQLADAYTVKDKILAYNSVGLNYDPGNWFVTTELTQSDSAGYLARYVNGYALLGVRSGAFTPYVLASRTQTTAGGSDTGNPIVEQIRHGAAQVGQKTLALGLRWDVVKNVAVKTEFAQTHLPDGSRGVLTNLQSGFVPGGSYKLYSVSVDFVF